MAQCSRSNAARCSLRWIGELCSQLSSNLSYDLPEWITGLLGKQKAVSQILFRGKDIKTCTEGSSIYLVWKSFRSLLSGTESCIPVLRVLVQVHMKDPCTAERKWWLTTPFLHLSCISPSSTQHKARSLDFPGTFPFPALCEGAALTVGTTSALLKETARRGWMMQLLHWTTWS